MYRIIKMNAALHLEKRKTFSLGNMQKIEPIIKLASHHATETQVSNKPNGPFGKQRATNNHLNIIITIKRFISSSNMLILEHFYFRKKT